MSGIDRVIWGKTSDDDTEEKKEGPVKSAFLGGLFKKLILASRTSQKLPTPEDFEYFESFGEFKQRTDALSKRILRLIGTLVEVVELDDPNLIDLDDEEEKFENVSSTVENLLERVDLDLDKLAGHHAHHKAVDSSKTLPSTRGRDTSRSLNALPKPQRLFKRPIDNSDKPWTPVLPFKPNAIAPLPDYSNLVAPSPQLSAAMAHHVKQLGMAPTRGSGTVPHPYEEEINSIVYSTQNVSGTKEQMYRPLGEISCTWVDTEEQLEELCAKLDEAKEIAIDLEHHSFRSFQGITCLMQVSTRKEDWLIDTLVLRDCLHLLNSSFTNPRIVKVLHGADMDILWLQRDFGLYIVNMFDTGQAARVLELPSFGLQYLLKFYCDVQVNKKYQLADWRIRPLPAEMLLYARQDTHYLLYVYDRMKNQLAESSEARRAAGRQVIPLEVVSGETVQVPHLLFQVTQRSNNVALKVYLKPALQAHYDCNHLCAKFNLVYTETQMRALRGLFTWRDKIAREQDESIAYVMPNHILQSLCSSMPMDAMSLLAACRPVPSLVRKHVNELVSIIHKARDEPESPALSSSLLPVQRMPSDLDLTKIPSTPSSSDGKPLETSPVMTQHELYNSAGWIGSRTNNFQGVGGPMGPGGVPLFDLSVLDTPQSERRMSLSETPIISSPAKGHYLLDILGDDDECGEADHQRRAREIRAEFHKADALKDMLTPNGQRKRTLATPPTSSNNTSKKLRTPETGELAMMSPLPPIIASGASPLLDTGIPSSMKDIYKLSNENRKKNKDKKKLKQSRSSGEDTQATSTGEKPVTKQANEFMKDIGWIGENEAGSEESSDKSTLPQSLNSIKAKSKAKERRGNKSNKRQSQNNASRGGPTGGAPQSNSGGSGGHPMQPQPQQHHNMHHNNNQHNQHNQHNNQFTPFDYNAARQQQRQQHHHQHQHQHQHQQRQRGPGIHQQQMQQPVFDPYAEAPRNGPPNGGRGTGMVPRQRMDPRTFSYRPQQQQGNQLRGRGGGRRY